VRDPGASAEAGRTTSLDRGRGLAALAAALEGLDGLAFPATKEAILASAGAVEVVVGRGVTLTLASLLENLNPEVYSSPAHVREAVALSWNDFADVHPPEGGG